MQLGEKGVGCIPDNIFFYKLLLLNVLIQSWNDSLLSGDVGGTDAKMRAEKGFLAT